MGHMCQYMSEREEIAAIPAANPANIPDVNDDFEGALAALVDWFNRDAPGLNRPWKLVQAASERLVAAGVPLEAFTAFVFTLHPDYFGVLHRWERKTGKVRSIQGLHSQIDSGEVKASPIAMIFKGVAGLRRRLDRPGFVADFPVLDEFAADGVTDYVLMRMEFTDGAMHCITLTTHRPGGFSTAELRLVDALLPYMARLTEIQSVRYMAATLLDTYVGHDAGEQILTGAIRRGSGETLHAVVWFSDLRDFTRLSNELPRDELIGLLNDYFDCIGPPVKAAGGEILKFIGDAVLAVVPLDEASREGAVRACDAAVVAAHEALANLDTLNATRVGEGKPAIAFGIALHVGGVMFGNIGTGDRLDFTVIGPAVNMAARLASLCGQLDEPVLVSEYFSAACTAPLDPLGAHALKGLEGEEQVFRPAVAAPKIVEAS